MVGLVCADALIHKALQLAHEMLDCRLLLLWNNNGGGFLHLHIGDIENKRRRIYRSLLCDFLHTPEAGHFLDIGKREVLRLGLV